MAHDKKVVMVYTDWMEKFEILEDDEAGRLIKHFFRFVNDLDPEAPDKITKLSFIDIENTLKRDLIKWEKTIEGRSKAGKASVEAKRLLKSNEQNSTNLTNVKSVEKNSTNSTVKDIDTVTVTVKDTVKVKEIKEYTPNGVVDLKNQPNVPKIDFDGLISFFNENRGLLPEVRNSTEARKKRILTLEKQYGKKAIMQVIEKTRDSYFLQGGNKENWTANFDWIFKPVNFLKILEDNYVNKDDIRNVNSQRTDAEHKQSATDAVNALFGIRKTSFTSNR
ncbi:MAG: DUF6291 domain-containing protein [Flavobacterium sp.]|jgi:hypothetical protein|nr:DUF6291 domain-containing protein [Flavobacterium sp.]